MASDLKKVGLVFNADGSTNFIKSLQLVNATLRENYQDFKLVQEQWDKSTTTSQKLNDQLTYLNNAYDIQKNKTIVLTKEIEELENAEKKDEIAIQKKKAALAQAETSLQKYQNQINETSAKIKLGTANLEDFAKNLNEVEVKLTSTGKKLSVFSAAYSAALTLSAKSAIEFESAFTGVEKTVDGTEEQLAELRQGIRDMAKELPLSTTEISAVAEAAGQLGIKTEDILSFTKVMVDLGNSTNLTAETAASSLAKLANIMNTSAEDYDRLGSTIVDLGNNFATTEADIVSMAMRIAGAGSTIGLTEADVLSLSAALSSVGIEAEAGGSAISKAMTKMAVAVETNSEDLKEFAKVAGMSTTEFKKSFETDAMTAITKFIVGLGDTESAGQSTLTMLQDLGFEEVRLRDTMLRSANASELFVNAVELGNKAWEENSALTKEAEKRYATTESQIAILKNTLNDVAISFGELLLPYLQQFVDGLKNVLTWVNSLDPSIKNIILTIGGLIAVIGPLLIVLGTLACSISNIIMLYTTYIAPILAGMATGISAILVPILAVIATIALVIAAIKQLWDTSEEFKNNVTSTIDGLKETFQNLWDNCLSPIIELFKETILDLWTNSLKPLWDSFVELIGSIINCSLMLWEKCKPIVDKIIEILGPVLLGVFFNLQAFFSGTITFILGVINTFINYFKDSVNSFTRIVSGIIDFIAGVFTGNWSKAWQGIVDIFGGIFNGIVDAAKVPINLVISMINGIISGINVFIKALNKLQIPDWVPGVGGKGLNFKTIDKIEYLAKGGDLLSGMAVVAEAGPELLLQQGNHTKVMPLSNGGGATPTQIIDYDKMAMAYLKALNSCKLSLDDDGFVKFIDDRLLEVI